LPALGIKLPTSIGALLRFRNPFAPIQEISSDTRIVECLERKIAEVLLDVGKHTPILEAGTLRKKTRLVIEGTSIPVVEDQP
jgi:hypothetical protein